MGIHLSNMTTMEQHEEVVQCIPVREFSNKKFILFFTKHGMVKKSTQDLYESNRYSRSLIALNLRDGDEVVNVFETDGKQDIFIATHLGYGLWFRSEERRVGKEDRYMDA